MSRPVDLGPAQAVSIGALTLTLPARRAISRKALASLDTLIAAELDGFAPLASRCLVDLETQLGVTQDDRVASGALDASQLTPAAEIERQAEAEQVLRARDAPHAAKLRAKRELDQTRARQRLRQTRVEEAEVARGLDESLRLAGVRAESMAVEQAGGKRRATRLGGLGLAYKRGVLDDSKVRREALMRAALLYRDRYETHVGGRGPDRMQALAVGRVVNTRGPRSALPQLEAGADLRRLRQGLSDIQRQTLDLVCGQDLTLNQAAQRLTRNPRTLEKALADGLAIVGENRGWW